MFRDIGLSLVIPISVVLTNISWSLCFSRLCYPNQFFMYFCTKSSTGTQGEFGYI